MKTILLMSAFVGLMIAQVTPTRIGEHQIGETVEQWHKAEPAKEAPSADQKNPIAPHQLREKFAQWLTLNQLNLTEICGKHKRSDNSADFKSVCRSLTAILNTGQGDFYTKNQFGQTFGWRFFSGVLTSYFSDSVWHNESEKLMNADVVEQGDQIVTTRDNRSYTWNFSNGKLSKVSITADWISIYKIYNEQGIARHPEVVPAFDEEVRFLTQTYGTPSNFERVPYQNAYAAHWERSRVQWNEPDGTVIFAFERSGFDQQGQLELVVFLSKEAAAVSKESKPNPYTRKQ
jgi:hypothetical protein